MTGLKENVIIGKLIPAGTGFRGDLEVSEGPIEQYEGVLLKPIEALEEAAAEDSLLSALRDVDAMASMTAAAPAPED